MKDRGLRMRAGARHWSAWGRRLATLVGLGVAFSAGQHVERHDDSPAQQSARPSTPAVREALALEGDLEDLEAEMHQGLYFTMHHGELARRHMQISAIACSSAEEHAMDALRLAQRAERRSERQAAARIKEKQEAANNRSKSTGQGTRTPHHRSG